MPLSNKRYWFAATSNPRFKGRECSVWAIGEGDNEIGFINDRELGLRIVEFLNSEDKLLDNYSRWTFLSDRVGHHRIEVIGKPPETVNVDGVAATRQS